MTTEHTDAGILLYDEAGLDPVLDRMAARAAGLLRDAEDPLLLGILRRGDPLAAMLQRRLRMKHGLELPRYRVALRRYGDDMGVRHGETELDENAEFAARDLSRATVLVVDDLLHQGNSLLRAIGYLTRRGALALHAAVLVDRCMARVPLRVAVTGLRLELAPGDRVECLIPPYEERFAIHLRRGAG